MTEYVEEEPKSVTVWINNYLLNDTLAGLRVGQSYLIRVRPDVNDPTLFYETCVDRAWVRIHSLYEDSGE
jgi:hypothetical protein